MCTSGKGFFRGAAGFLKMTAVGARGRSEALGKLEGALVCSTRLDKTKGPLEAVAIETVLGAEVLRLAL